MPSQKIIWSVLPYGRQADGTGKGQWRVSIVVSPRLTPEKPSEQLLKAFPEWLDWPATVMRQKFRLEIGGKKVGLTPVHQFGETPDTAPDSTLWQRLFAADMAVSGFKLMDMAAVNLRSYPVRNVLDFVRRHYRDISAGAAAAHPTLLPWGNADPALKGMLAEAGTRTTPYVTGNRRLESLEPGFDRFHALGAHGENDGGFNDVIDRSVFNAKSCIKAPVQLAGVDAPLITFPLRALPPDWEDPEKLRSGLIAVSDASDREPRARLMEKFSSPAEYALWQSDRFYRRTVATDAELAMGRPDFKNVAPPPAIPVYDFHQRVSSYGDHANLLRRLGLVIDCVLDSNDAVDALLAAGNPAQGFMSLLMASNEPHKPSRDTFPRTAWMATKRRFVLQSRTEDHAGGLLKLENANDQHSAQDHTDKPSPFDVYQVDPDGAALKTNNFVLTAQRLVRKHLVLGADGEVTYSAGDTQAIAALRSGGLGISQHGRAGRVATMAKAAALNNERILSGGSTAAEVTLYAEDVLRGYRVDVLDGEVGKWKSLCQRELRYTALPRGVGDEAVAIALPADEGCVKSASTTSSNDKPDDHYLHETLFRWTGWSLAAPRPGRAIRDSTVPGTHLQNEDLVDADLDEATAPNVNGLAIKVTATKGTLPRLRFGHTYRMRARLVDLAGNSLALDERDLTPTEQATEPVTYGRFEPLNPPAMVLKQKLSEGESLERLVLRSNFDRSTVDYTDDIANSPELNTLYSNPDFQYTVTSERHVVPAKSSQQQCELHGMFDFAIGNADPDAAKKAFAIAGRESGSLMKGTTGTEIIELVTPASVADVATQSGTMAPPDQADADKDRFAAGQYLIHREALIPVPYLADPACGGMALHNVPGIWQLTKGRALELLAPGLIGVVIEKGLRAAWLRKQERWVLLVDFDADPSDEPLVDWPDDVQSLRLVVVEQPGEVNTPPCGAEHTPSDAPLWNAQDRTLTLFLPKGHIARLRYASFVHDRLIDHFGLPRWHTDADASSQLRAEAMAGSNWTMTPWRDVTLVHATQQPVCLPSMSGIAVQRELGAQFALLGADAVRLHGPSTGKFEIVGAWDEWIDDPAQPAPRRKDHQAQLSEIRLDENHRNEFVLQEAIDAQNAFEPVGGQVTAADVAKRPALAGNRHEFGDTRFRFVRYHLRAATRFREYLPPDVYNKDAGALITRDGPLVQAHLINVRSLPLLNIDSDPGAPMLEATGHGATGLPGVIIKASAPPTVPELVYTVPTFLWDRPAPNAGTVQSTRHGNGLRVYLDRPWFSSGDGELLGVVIRGNEVAFKGIEASMLPFVTQWGRDPIWDSGAPSTQSRVSDFPAAVASEPVTLLEAPDTMVWVVGHRVHFDAARQLWYCDIELNPGATYMPFVRLALVRYQPNAIEQAKVSKVVLGEFAQVLPRRSAVLNWQAAALTVKLYGPVPDRGPMRQFSTGGVGESPYIGISPGPGIGQFAETGRNRVELVLQTRDAVIDSDLAWSDHSMLGSGMLGQTTTVAPAPVVSPLNPLGPQVVPFQPGVIQPVNPLTGVPIRTRLGRTLRFDRAEARVDMPTLGAVAIDGAFAKRPPWNLIDPPVWSLAASLPALPTDRPARLMLREFERFYTDRTVPENLAGKSGRRVVIEERLVYAEVFALG
jgi:hypothetical protein